MKTDYYSREKILVFESKTEIWESVTTFKITELQQYLLNLQNDGWEEIVFDTDFDSSVIELIARKGREETDAEYNKRMKAINRIEKERKVERERVKLKKEEQDRKEYERLKKKFEND